MEKLYIATRDEFLSLIDEGVRLALSRLPSVPNEQPRSHPAGTKKEVAEYLMISPSTLQRLTKTGEIKSFNIGSQVRYKWENVEEYLKSKG